MGELSYTVGGDSNLVSFKSAARVPITSLKAHFKPKQDLHGYSKPWPAGGGKNLFNINSSEQDPSNIDIYNNSIRIFTPGTYTRCASWSNYRDPSRILDFSILGNIMTVKSTTGYGVGYAITILPETQYAISAIVNGVGASINIAYYDSNGNFLSEAANETNVANSVITTPSNSTIAVLIFRGTYADTAVTFANIQFEKSSSITSYEPYENICPIEGWNQCEAYHTGKNLLKYWKNGYYSSSRGYFIDSPNNACFFPIKVKSTDVLYFSAIYPIISGNVYFFSKPNVMSNNTYISGKSIGSSDIGRSYIKITPPQDCWLVLQIDYQSERTAENAYEKEPQLEFETFSNGVSLKATSYEPYQGEIIPVTFPITGKNKFNSDPSSWETNLVYCYCKISDNNDVYSLSFKDKDTSVNVSDISLGFCYSFPVNGTVAGEGFNWPLDTGGWRNNRTNIVTKGSNSSLLGKSCQYMILYPKDALARLTARYDIQLELGSTVTEYEDPDRTIYGGYIDPVAGEAIAEWAEVDLGKFDYMVSSSQYGSFTFADNTFNIFTSRSQPGNMFFDKVATVDSDTFNTSCVGQPGFYAHCGSQNGGIYIMSPNLSGMTGQEVKEALTGYKMVYKLSNPVHYPLLKTEFRTLLSQNNIWSNTNDITEVSYAIHDAAPIRAAKHRIAANEPHIETVNGSMAHFSTNMKAPLKSCKVYFNPVQEGSGDPSPSNVRTISGRTGFEVCKTGKNLFNINANWQNLLSTYKYAKMLPNELCRIRFIPKNLSVDLTGCSLGFVYFEPNSVAQANKGYNWVMESGVIKADNRLHNKVVGGDYSGLYCQYIFVYPGTDEALNTITSAYDIEIEPDNLNTNYEPYIGTALPLNWSSTAGTIYGGYVDLMSGELVATGTLLTLTNATGFEMLARRETTGGYFFHKQHIQPNCLNMIESTALEVEKYTHGIIKNPWAHVANAVYAFRTNSGCTIRIGFEDSENIDSVNDLDAWIKAQGSISIYYPIDTPITYQLSPQQLKSLKGVNNIWSDANGNVEVSYWTH